MSRWYERECEALEDELAKGLIDQKEFNRAMRELNDEERAAADEAAEQARNDYLGGW